MDISLTWFNPNIIFDARERKAVERIHRKAVAPVQRKAVGLAHKINLSNYKTERKTGKEDRKGKERKDRKEGTNKSKEKRKNEGRKERRKKEKN
jgi:hypothetical protein